MTFGKIPAGRFQNELKLHFLKIRLFLGILKNDVRYYWRVRYRGDRY